MGSTSKRAATTAVQYTFSDEDEQDLETVAVKRGAKKKKEEKLKTVVCKICHKKYTGQEGLKRHMVLHKETLDYACDICDARFKTSGYLGRHRKQVHTTPSHECDFCGKRFTMPYKLDQHRLVHTGEKPFKCEVCGKAFRAPYSLNTHRFTHTNEKPYKCQYCPYACRDNSTLRKHHERHTGTLKWHECAYCDKKYYAKHLLKSHISERHFAVDLKVLPCPQCDSKFKTKAQLNTHIKTVHERALRATCEVCGVEISNKHNMSSHLRAHIDVRPYKCKVKSCQRKFKDLSTLKKHSLIHKPREQHACEVCGKLFARRNRLNVHMRKHGAESKAKIMFCDYCGFSYDNRQCLIRHILKHIRHRNTYVCDICKYITHRKLSIEKHMKYGHGDEDDRYCKICDKTYKLHAYLILHYYNRHGVRYKTVKNIKLETSVTIKEEPQEPIAEAEVDLEEIQKQEPLADIITDVALDCDATDMSYSKAVLTEDVQRVSRNTQYATTHTFRRRLRGRAALIEDQNTLYARKEKDVKKRINRLLARVRLKKWTRVLERARRQYNDRIRSLSVKHNENNVKVKFVNVQANDVKKTETNSNDNNNDEFKSNTDYLETKMVKDEIKTTVGTDIGNVLKSYCTIGGEINDDNVRNDEALVQESCNEKEVSYSTGNDTERDDDNMTNDDAETVESFDTETDVGVRNVYEDVLDIEENPVVKIDNEEIDTVINDTSHSGSDQLENKIADDTNLENNDLEEIKIPKSTNKYNKEENLCEINKEQSPVDLKSNVINLENNSVSISSEESNLQTDKVHSKGKKKHKSNEIDKVSKEHCNTENINLNSGHNDEYIIMDSDDEIHKINDKEGERGKNIKLKINTHQCYVCHKLYETKKKLLEHCQEHFGICTDIPLKKCPLCNYVTKSTITSHLKLVHDITINLQYHTLHDKNKCTQESSRYYYNVDDKVVKEIEIIPSVRNLNKIAYVEIDKKNRKAKDLSVAKTKLVKKSGEWVVESEKMKVNNEFLLPEFNKKEIKRLKHVGDDYLDVIKVLGRLAKRHNAKILYPCNGCEKLCQTFAALKLHSRKHETNPKPFKKKVWKHKLKPNELKAMKTKNIRTKVTTKHVGQAKPKPIENKHKCDRKLIEFYEKNVKGGDIEFWQFLKIYNRMNKDYENLDKLKETNEFGDYTENTDDITTRNEVVTQNDEVKSAKAVVTLQNDKRLSKLKVRNKFTRKIILSKQERLRRDRIKEQLRKKITGNQ